MFTDTMWLQQIGYIAGGSE